MVASLNKFVLSLISVLSTVSFPVWSAPASGTEEEISAPLPRVETDSISDFIVSNWRAGDGLPANDIQELKETPDGYLWLGTYQGLVRFDGIKFQNFFT